jgi:O-antigen ligase
LVTFASYQLFEPIRYGIWKASQTVQPVGTDDISRPETSPAVQAEQINEDSLSNEKNMSDPDSGYHPDARDYLKSGRKQIFWSALKSLQLEPKRLLIGSGYYHVMDISHQLISEQAKHFHNTFLQVINEFGIIGLVLVLWFYWRILLAVFHLTITPTEAVSASNQMLILVPLMLIFYFMLEVGIFAIIDMANIRNTVFYFTCGMLIGYDTNVQIFRI